MKNGTNLSDFSPDFLVLYLGNEIRIREKIKIKKIEEKKRKKK